jgi:hypothetical protein
MTLVTVRDEAPGGPAFDIDIELESVEVTAAELIRGRVVAELSRIRGVLPRPLVAMSREELALNGPRRPADRLDVDHEVSRALTAFEQGRFVLLVGGRQLERIDEPVAVSAQTPVTFIRLVPLRGG